MENSRYFTRSRAPFLRVNFSCRRVVAALAFGAMSVCFVSRVGAADITWNGGGADGNWATGANWGGTAPNGNDNLIFAGTTRLISTNNLTAGALANNGIEFSAGAGSFTLNGSTLTLDGGAAMVVNSSTNLQTINLSIAMAAAGTFNTASGSVAMNGQVSGAFALTKLGASTLFLTASNTYTGATAISAGAVRIANSNALGTTAAGTTVATGAALELSNNISVGAEALSIAGTGIGGAGALRNISGTNTYGGAITLTAAASIEADADTELKLTNTVSGNFAKTFDGAGDISAHGAISGSGGLVKSGAGVLTLAAANNFTGSLTNLGGTVRGISNASAFGSVTSLILAGGNMEMANDTGLNFAEALLVSNNATITSDRLTAGAGVIHTNNTLSIGAQTLTIAAGTNVTSGVGSVAFSGTTTLRASGAQFLVNSNAQLTLGAVAGNTFGFTVGGEGNTTVGGVIGTTTGTVSKTGAGTLTMGSAANTYGGVTTVGGGVLRVTNLANAGANSSIGTNATIILTNGGTLDYAGTTNSSMNRGINLASGNGGIGVSNSAAALTLSGVISNTGSLVKSGAGTLILTASNNYSGGTLLNAGTLVASNLFAFGTNSITLNAGLLNLSSNSIANLIINNGGTLTNLGTVSGAELNGGTTTLTASNSTVAEVSGTATVNVSGANTTITNMSGGTVNATTNLVVQTFDGGTISNSTAVTIDSGNSAGSISGGGNLIKTGSGTLALSGNNTFTGATVISNGAVSISTNAALAGTTQVQMNGGTALEYTGGSATLDRNISVTNGTGTIRNTGAGTLALSGNLSKNGTILRFNNGTFNVTGVISGASANSDLIVDDATVTLSNANTYNGPTFIVNGGSLTAAVSGAMPTSTRSAVIMDDTGTGSSSFTITASQQIASLSGISSSTASIATNTSLTIGTTSGNTTFAGVISGSGSLIKDGASTQTLSGANTYTGSTTIDGGALSVSADNNLGAAPGTATAGSLTFSNGTLLVTSGFTLNANRGIALGTGGGTFNVASGQNLSYAGSITGANALTKTGAGTMTLSSSNAYTGANTLSAGTLRAANAFALGSLNAGDALTLAGGRLELAADTATIFGPGSGYGTIVSSNSTIVSDRLTAGAGVAQQLGTLSIGAQTLSVDKGSNVTSGTATLTIGGATTLTGNATFATAAGTQLLFDNTISGAFNITKTGDGILTLNRGGGQADNTITAGQLNINHFQALGTSPGTLTLAGGVTLDNTSTNAVTVGNAKSISLGSSLNFLGSNSLNLGSGTTTLSTNVTIDVTANTLAFGGDMTGAFGLTKTGAGTLELAGLTGSNSFTGNSFINGGELFLSGTSVFGGTTNTTVTIGTNSFLRIGASAGLGNVTLVLDNADGLILSSIITNNVVFSNSGTISSTYSNVDGSITIGEGVTMSTAANNLGTIPTTNTPGRIVLENNATLAATATFTINQNQGITLQPGTATFSPGTNVQVFIASSIAGDGELRKTGAGNIRLTGSNSYTGGTVIDQGIIGITSDSSLGAVTGRVKLNNGTLVAAQNNTGGPTNSGTTVNSARTLVLGNGTTSNIDAQTGLFFEYNGVIGEENGAGAASALRFGIAGTREGTVKLGGLNTYDGATTIVAGTLEAAHLGNGGAASSIGQSGNAASNLVIGGTLRYTGTNASTDRLFTIGSTGVATIDSGSGSLAFNNTGSVGFASTNLARHDITLTGTGTGSMALTLADDAQNDPLHVTKNGSGLWTLSGNNDYTGATTIAGGTLQVSSDANLGRTTAGEGLVFTNGATLKTTGSFTNNRSVLLAGNGTVDTAGNTLTLGGLISGTNVLTKVGLGTLVLAGNNTFSGGTTLSSGGGTLALSTANALGSGRFTQSDGSSTLVIDTTGTITNQMDIYNVSVLQSVTMTGAKTLFNATYNVTNNTTTTEAGDLSGTGGVTKLGTGTLLLSGNNTYSGAVDVQAGLLNLNSSVGGAAALASSVSVTNGATLLVSQSNQVNDSATVTLSGGTIQRASGVSEVFGNLNVTTGSVLDFGSGTAGTITFSGLDYTPSAILTLQLFNFTQGNTLVINNTSDWTSQINSGFTFGGAGGFGSTSFSGGTFTITAIPEPSTYLAATGLLAVLLWPSRKRIIRYTKRTLGLRPPMRDRLARKVSEVR